MPTISEIMDAKRLGLLDRPVPRDPSYEYGSILPFRKPKSGGPAEWGLTYSDTVKSLLDAFSAPGRAYNGQEMRPDDAMNFALANMGAAMSAGRAPSGSVGMNVFHGSPHKFNKFDSAKIGTGDGTQAYGHGIYVAESPNVARMYSTNLSNQNDFGPVGMASQALHAAGGDLLKARQALYAHYNQAPDKASANLAWQAIEALNKGKAKTPNFYKADLPDKAIGAMLDWDKPVSSQSPAVKGLARKLGLPETASGGDLYTILADQLRSDAMRVPGPDSAVAAEAQRLASKHLESLGVPGIRYMDGLSRSAGEGTSNFVVFNDNLLKILDRK